MVTIQELLTPVTAAQMRVTMVQALKTLGIPADQWKVGGIASTILTVCATMLAGFSTMLVQGIGSGFLTTATGGWLSLVAYYVYGVTRPAATFANGTLTLTNSGGGVYSYAPYQATFFDPVSKQTYANTQAIALGALGTQTVAIACTVAGSAGSAPPGEITGLSTAMLGVNVSNPTACVGQDAMSDANLVLLCQAKLGASSVRGPRSAFAYAIQVAVNAVNGAPVNINRSSISRSSHTGTVTIYISSPSGTVDANDLLGVENAIESGVPGLSPPFSGARPDCVTVNVYAATPVNYSEAITVWCQALPGYTTSLVQQAVEDALTAYFAAYPIGGLTSDTGTGIFATGIDGVCQAAIPGIFAVEGNFDTPLLPGQVAVDATTVTVRLVPASN